MNRHLLLRVLTSAAVPVLVASMSTPALSQEREGFAKEGGYIGITGLLDFTFDGVTFDGSTGYIQVDGDEVMILPRLDKRNLVRAALGHRWQRASFEVSYDQTTHSGTFLEEVGEATFRSLNVDSRFYMATRGPVQPVRPCRRRGSLAHDQGRQLPQRHGRRCAVQRLGCQH